VESFRLDLPKVRIAVHTVLRAAREATSERHEVNLRNKYNASGPALVALNTRRSTRQGPLARSCVLYSVRRGSGQAQGRRKWPTASTVGTACMSARPAPLGRLPQGVSESRNPSQTSRLES